MKLMTDRNYTARANSCPKGPSPQRFLGRAASVSRKARVNQQTSCLSLSKAFGSGFILWLPKFWTKKCFVSTWLKLKNHSLFVF